MDDDASAQIPDHPIITEVFNNPLGDNDGPVGSVATNPHQEYIEIYLPPAAALDPALDKDALNLAFYEVEGDNSSSGYTLVNYRFDLPTFDLDSSNGLTGIARPASGVVVLGWLDYVGNPPTDLAGTPSTRIAMVNGGITTTGGDYTFVAINGNQFGGTTNFPTVAAESLIQLPGEASSGVIQNGSAAYLLVNRDDPGYVELYDDNDPAHVPPISNADPALATGTVLNTSCLLDAYAANDDSAFVVEDQPYPFGNDIDLDEVLPIGGPFSNLIPQIAEESTDPITPTLGGGYARVYADDPKTTETGAADDPVQDALQAYRLIRNEGPFLPNPGKAALTTSPPELEVASLVNEFEVISQTTGNPIFVAANTGGDYLIDIQATQGNSSDPLTVVYGAGFAAIGVAGQSFGFPTVGLSALTGATDGAMTTGTATLTATNTNGGDPAVVNAVQEVAITATVLNPTTGTAANGQPFQTTVFAAIQPITDMPGVNNEFLDTSLGMYLAAQPDVNALDTEDHGNDLINPATNIRSAAVVVPWIKEMPEEGEECSNWLQPPGVDGADDFATTVLNSAEVVSGSSAYDDSISVCFIDPFPTVIKGVRFNVPDTFTFGGTFSPTEPVNFVDATGTVGDQRSGLSNAVTTRSFEVAFLDTNVRANNTLETGRTDDFGIVIEVGDVEEGASVITGEFVALSLTGGFGLADIDSLEAAAESIASIVMLDLDNLNSVLGVRTIEAFYIVDAGASGEVDFIEAFSLNFTVGCTTDADCDDGNLCTEDACSGVNDTCEYTLLTGDFDQDGLFCNGIDQCISGVFVTGTPINCGDGNICTDDSCDEGQEACVNANNSLPCDDDNVCTEFDTCVGGACQGDPIPGCGCTIDEQCDDGSSCTVDTCDTGLGICEFTPNDGLCADDGIFCNGSEVCVGAAGDPSTGCTSSGPPCENCTEETGCDCETPFAVSYGSRYVAITPAPGTEPVALVVTTCGGALPQYVGALPGETSIVPIDLTNDGTDDGMLAGLVDNGADALYLTPGEWGNVVYVTGFRLVPAGTFDVQADCGTPGNPNLTAAVAVTTAQYGDVNGDENSNFADILAAVQGFQQTYFEGNDKLLSDLAECYPNQLNNFTDILYAVNGFQQSAMIDICPQSYDCP
jgi:hypothetical protein